MSARIPGVCQAYGHFDVKLMPTYAAKIFLISVFIFAITIKAVTVVGTRKADGSSTFINFTVRNNQRGEMY